MSSEEANAALSQKLATKFEELLASRGNPTELDDAFKKEYFSTLDNDDRFTKDAKAAEAHFQSQSTQHGSGSLLRVNVEDLGVFFVRPGEDLLPLKGTARGYVTGRCQYIIKTIASKKSTIPGYWVQITIFRNLLAVVFISDKPCYHKEEHGFGEWNPEGVKK